MKSQTLCFLRDLHGLTKVSLMANYELKFDTLITGKNDNERNLLNAWNQLSDADLHHTATYDSARLILQNTFPGEAITHSLSSLTLEQSEDVKPKATAANPRAFKGTKRRPPKPVEPKTIDLRPYLMSKLGTQQLAALDENLKNSLRNPQAEVRNLFSILPVDFRLTFFVHLLNEDLVLINKFLKLYFDLQLNDDTKLRTSSLKILHNTTPEAALRLLSTLLLLEIDKRSGALDLTIKMLGPHKIVSHLDHLCDGIKLAIEFEEFSDFSKVWKLVLSGICNNASLELLRFALELHRDYNALLPVEDDFEHVFIQNTKHDLCQREEIRNLMTFFANNKSSTASYNRPEYSDGVKLAIYCANSKDNEKCIESIAWKDLDLEIAVRLIRCMYYQKLPNSILEPLVSFLLKHGNSDKARSLLNEFNSIYYSWDNEFKISPDFFEWFLRIEDLEDSNDAYLGEVCMQLYFGFEKPYRERLKEVDDASLEQIIKACFRINDANLIISALKTLQRLYPELLLQSLNKAPKTLMKTLKTMGCLNQHMRETTLKKFVQSSIFKLRPQLEITEQDIF